MREVLRYKEELFKPRLQAISNRRAFTQIQKVPEDRNTKKVLFKSRLPRTGDIHQAMVKGRALFGIDAADCMFHAPVFTGFWRDYLVQYRSHEPESLPIILEMMRRIASHPELPDLIDQELEEAPCPVFDIPYREVARYGSDVRLMHQDLMDALERERN
jgi:hypothetical protein